MASSQRGDTTVSLPLLALDTEDSASYISDKQAHPAAWSIAAPREAPAPISLYRRWKLDYISTGLLATLAALWLSGAVDCTSSWTESDANTSRSRFELASAKRFGYEGPTPTGSEPLAAATAYSSYRDTSPLKPPQSQFDILSHFGNLSPWRSVNHGLKGSPEVPAECKIEQVQLLHRHGARYPTTGAGPADLATKLKAATSFSRDLTFLSNWDYKLGAEILTPFGREQLFNLGTSFRVKYGALLDNDEDNVTRRKPLFRTETQDRMLKSALNFAAGFFGIPYEEQYDQLVTIEWPGFNNTLSPYMTCTNANRRDLTLGPARMAEWMSLYLKDARARLNHQLEGIELSFRDVFNIQQMCAYELVALGGSKFCELFTEDEWRGFEYAIDIQFYYEFSFGQPAQAALGKGWVQEWLARVMQQPLAEFNSTTNATYHSEGSFPLDQALYVDATHDTVISAVITTLRFSSLAATGPLPSDHIPANLSFVTSKISPFAANLHSQIVSCTYSHSSPPRRRVRWILNDGVVPLDHIKGCGSSDQGWCDLDTFVSSTRKFLSEIDWAYDCLEPYMLGSDPITDGRPPPRSSR
ncbi:hypothetical protein ACM66B_003313 [Microbotryomycetes sp. NB124-2]